ncbi:hypothetical protein HU200_028785 [Digitaria exilis]|uniref:NB-ARC domain-containing protein n=1 Tax=Digitaria exilis TaxID=1010633 RepID=A0A835C3V4_9POAL|nr:hypothetical protein HU200_028785 [Digitaria exilis]
MDVVSLLPAYNPTTVFRHRMGKKLQKIVQDIDVLVAEMNAFGFSHKQQAPPLKPSRQTDPVMIESEKDIVKRSRKNEEEKIVKMLFDHANNDDLLVLPIVGLGGLGKTTIAQLVYSNPKIESHFQFQKWYCVSEDFDVGNIARNICNSTEKDIEKVLQNLQKELSGKRCLIVLDDVWNLGVDKWDKLKACLKHAGTGSAILTTTRDAKVATIMSAEFHTLGSLGDVFLKEILERRAFSFQKPDMLSWRTIEGEWIAVLNKNSICNAESGILPILKLSYDNLTLHMKQCFAFCAVFPKDYEIDVENLIQLWMANDYLPLEEEFPLETTGRRTFEELAWRSFFEDAKQTKLEDKNLTHFSSIKTCKIHDLMHDIALSVLGEECATITERLDQKKLLPKHSRHMFSSYRETGTCLIDILKKQAPALQTLLCPSPGARNWTPHMPKCSSLRALKLSDSSAFQIRPRDLQHLRYLDLSENLWIKQLPEEISILYNLQTLNVWGCWKLCRLPRGMKYMASLRCLYTEGCESLKFMPPDLGQLSSLHTLTYFVASASSGCSTIGELRNLDLGGKLVLSCLENVTEAQAKAATLGKEKLRSLSLKWSSECHEEPVPDCHKKLLGALKPHDGLEMLRIVGYKSTCLPTWMKDLSSLQKHLTELYLVGFTLCEEFPEFSHLEALRILRLGELDKLQSLCSDEASLTFLKLKELKLHDLKSMERWVAAEGREGEVAFPQLENLIIRGCPNLSTLPVDTPNIKVVELKEDKAQLSLLIVGCRYLSFMSDLSLLVRDKEAALVLDDEKVESPLLKLRFYGCDFFFPSSPSQTALGIWRWFGNLVSLDINNCDALTYWPEDAFRSLVSLKHLYFYNCKNLVGKSTQVKGESAPTRTYVLPRLNILSVGDCGRLAELFALPPSITEMRIWNCESLQFMWEVEAESKGVHVERLDTSMSQGNRASTSVPKQSAAPTTHPLPCLEFLSIGGCDSLVTLPDLPPALRSLNIWRCQKLCSVSGQLDALERLSIGNCNALQSLDSLGHLPSLIGLDLQRCKRLISVPGALGGYSALRELTIRYCPAIDMKPLYQRHRRRIDSLEERDLSHAHSSDPREEWIQRPPGTEQGRQQQALADVDAEAEDLLVAFAMW